jgi:hypothetical protein
MVSKISVQEGTFMLLGISTDKHKKIAKFLDTKNRTRVTIEEKILKFFISFVHFFDPNKNLKSLTERVKKLEGERSEKIQDPKTLPLSQEKAQLSVKDQLPDDFFNQTFEDKEALPEGFFGG